MERRPLSFLRGVDGRPIQLTEHELLSPPQYHGQSSTLFCMPNLKARGLPPRWVGIRRHNTKNREKPCLALLHTTLTHVRSSMRSRETLGLLQLNAPEWAVTGDTLESTTDGLLAKRGKLNLELGAVNEGIESVVSGCMRLRLWTFRLLRPIERYCRYDEAKRLVVIRHDLLATGVRK